MWAVTAIDTIRGRVIPATQQTLGLPAGVDPVTENESVGIANAVMIRRRRRAPRYPIPPIWALIAAGVLLVWAPESAVAHILRETGGGFTSGFAHPLTGPDHFLAMFAVGLWGAQMGGRYIWSLPVTFPLVMTLGGLAGMFGLPLPHVELGIALSIIVLGSSIVFAWRPLELVALLVVGVFAIFHGYAHGVELPRAADPTDYAVGFVLATGLIHLFGIGVGMVLGKPLGGWLARALGVAIVAGGGYFLVV